MIAHKVQFSDTRPTNSKSKMEQKQDKWKLSGIWYGCGYGVRLLVSKNLGFVDMDPKLDTGAGIQHITSA